MTPIEASSPLPTPEVPPEAQVIKKVFILRGLPGSGKSHWIAEHRKQFATIGTIVVSADFYHMEQCGLESKYVFKKEKAREAHNKALLGFVMSLQHKTPVIYVDNTNISPWEISPFYRLAEVYGYEAEIVIMDVHVDVAKARQTHGVPNETYDEMEQRWHYHWETRPRWWKVSTVKTGDVEDLMETRVDRHRAFTL